MEVGNFAKSKQSDLRADKNRRPQWAFNLARNSAPDIGLSCPLKMCTRSVKFDVILVTNDVFELNSLKVRCVMCTNIKDDGIHIK